MSKSTRQKPNILPRQRVVVKPETRILEGVISRDVPIVRTVPEYVPLIYSDGMLVQEREGMFILHFLQTQFPLVVSSNELKDIEEVEQRCLAQVVVTPKIMKKIIDAMTNTYSKYVDKIEKTIKETE